MLRHKHHLPAMDALMKNLEKINNWTTARMERHCEMPYRFDSEIEDDDDEPVFQELPYILEHEYMRAAPEQLFSISRAKLEAETNRLLHLCDARISAYAKLIDKHNAVGVTQELVQEADNFLRMSRNTYLPSTRHDLRDCEEVLNPRKLFPGNPEFTEFWGAYRFAREMRAFQNDHGAAGIQMYNVRRWLQLGQFDLAERALATPITGVMRICMHRDYVDLRTIGYPRCALLMCKHVGVVNRQALREYLTVIADRADMRAVAEYIRAELA